MIKIAPFKALRPEPQLARQVASRPYDVLNSREAKTEAQGNPNSFLHITKSEIDLPEQTDIHSDIVYKTAAENLKAFMSRNVLFKENKSCYYIYRLIMNGRSQTGLVCTSSVDDYENGLIKKHEFTRPEKELDRINHIKTTRAQTGNVFLAYRNVEEMDQLVSKWCADKSPQYDFMAEDGIQHSIWIVSDDQAVSEITRIFQEKVPCTYIADGHHRAASAAKVRQALGKDATSESDYFLTTLFPSSQLAILDYDRVISDLNGHDASSIISALQEHFIVEEVGQICKPAQLHELGMYIDKKWYKLTAKDGTYTNDRS